MLEYDVEVYSADGPSLMMWLCRLVITSQATRPAHVSAKFTAATEQEAPHDHETKIIRVDEVHRRPIPLSSHGASQQHRRSSPTTGAVLRHREPILALHRSRLALLHFTSILNDCSATFIKDSRASTFSSPELLRRNNHASYAFRKRSDSS